MDQFPQMFVCDSDTPCHTKTCLSPPPPPLKTPLGHCTIIYNGLGRGGGEVWLWYNTKLLYSIRMSHFIPFFFNFTTTPSNFCVFKFPSVRLQCHGLLLFVVKLRVFCLHNLSSSSRILWSCRPKFSPTLQTKPYRHLIEEKTHLLSLSYHLISYF